MSLGILCEYLDTDEEGIKITAQDMGVDLKYIPFRKVSILIGNNCFGFKSRGSDYASLINGVTGILNRTQSKNRRLYSAHILESLGKYVLNPSRVESTCFSKLRTLIEFWKNKIPIPRTVYIPCDSHDVARGSIRIHNEETVADLVQRDLGNGNVVIKPDAGTHGRQVRLAQDRESLIRILDETEPSIINPVGFVAQEFIEKWFYDLRIIVAKEHGAPAYCFLTALARAGLKEFRTNTYLGNMVFGVKLPPEVQRTAVRAAEAVAKEEAWVLALDAMVSVGENRFVDDMYIKSQFDELVPSFEKVKEIKQDTQNKIRDFRIWNRKLEEAYGAYTDESAYASIKETVEKSIELDKTRVLFHEANSCPEFWEQTRLIAGINLAIPLLECAKSVEGRSSHEELELVQRG